jgi:hypothetical protein
MTITNPNPILELSTRIGADILESVVVIDQEIMTTTREPKYFGILSEYIERRRREPESFLIATQSFAKRSPQKLKSSPQKSKGPKP